MCAAKIVIFHRFNRSNGLRSRRTEANHSVVHRVFVQNENLPPLIRFKFIVIKLRHLTTRRSILRVSSNDWHERDATGSNRIT